MPGFLSEVNKLDQKRCNFWKLAFSSLNIFDENTIAKLVFDMDIPEKRDSGPWENPGPRTLWGPRTLGGLRPWEDPELNKNQDPMRTHNPKRTQDLVIPWGPRALWELIILWWPTKDPETHKLAKVFWFTHHVFNLVEFPIEDTGNSCEYSLF